MSEGNLKALKNTSFVFNSWANDAEYRTALSDVLEKFVATMIEYIVLVKKVY